MHLHKLEEKDVCLYIGKHIYLTSQALQRTPQSFMHPWVQNTIEDPQPLDQRGLAPVCGLRTLLTSAKGSLLG